MPTATAAFSATGTIQTYLVETTGTYAIEASGAQAGGSAERAGSKGARLSGMFLLHSGERVKIVVGRRGAAANPPHLPLGGSGGSSLVWIGASDLPQPIKLMLSARGGRAGALASAAHEHEPGTWSGNAELDPLTTAALSTQWTRAAHSADSGDRRDPVRIDRCGYNAGAFPTNTPDAQAGDGCVTIRQLVVGGAEHTGSTPVEDAVRAEPVAPGASALEQTRSPAPSPSVLPEVSPRPRLFARLLRRASTEKPQ